jgi:hypothetical protein
MRTRLRLAVILVALIAFVFAAASLLRSRESEALLGFWDTGTFDRYAIRQAQPVPASQLASLIGVDLLRFNPSNASLRAKSMVELFAWYGLDSGYYERTRNRPENRAMGDYIQDLDIVVPLSGDPDARINVR